MVALSFGLSLATTELAGGDSSSLQDRSTVGQSFDAVSAVFSGLALLAVSVTGYVQQRELANQREHARRNADAAVLNNHMALLRLSLEDAELASVWPTFAGPLSRQLERQYLYANMIVNHLASRQLERQYLYANMIVNHLARAFQCGDASELEVRVELQHLFTSHVIRDYWNLSRSVRGRLPADASAHDFNHLADEEWERSRRTPPTSNR